MKSLIRNTIILSLLLSSLGTNAMFDGAKNWFSSKVSSMHQTVATRVSDLSPYVNTTYTDVLNKLKACDFSAKMNLLQERAVQSFQGFKALDKKTQCAIAVGACALPVAWYYRNGIKRQANRFKNFANTLVYHAKKAMLRPLVPGFLQVPDAVITFENAGTPETDWNEFTQRQQAEKAEQRRQEQQANQRRKEAAQGQKAYENEVAQAKKQAAQKSTMLDIQAGWEDLNRGLGGAIRKLNAEIAQSAYENVVAQAEKTEAEAELQKQQDIMDAVVFSRM